MAWEKPRENLTSAVFLPHYKRDEYTTKCVKAIKVAQDYPKTDFYIVHDDPNVGLRTRTIEFFENVVGKYDVIAKVDNDCIVPKNWLNDLIDVLHTYDLDIVSPNVFPSNAAYKHGKPLPGRPYRPAGIVGGLWCMRTSMIEGIDFIKHYTEGLTGSVALLQQIKREKDPRIAWVTTVTFQDVGHWSGRHPDCIKTEEHKNYYYEVGRSISWG